MNQGPHSKCIFKFPEFHCFFPVQLQIFPVPIFVHVTCYFMYYIHNTDLADIYTFLKNNGKFHCKYHNILYIKNQGIYNFSKHISLCFGKISKFPVFSLTVTFFGHFPCSPCAVGTVINVICLHNKDKPW